MGTSTNQDDLRQLLGIQSAQQPSSNQDDLRKLLGITTPTSTQPKQPLKFTDQTWNAMSPGVQQSYQRNYNIEIVPVQKSESIPTQPEEQKPSMAQWATKALIEPIVKGEQAGARTSQKLRAGYLKTMGVIPSVTKLENKVFVEKDRAWLNDMASKGKIPPESDIIAKLGEDRGSKLVSEIRRLSPNLFKPEATRRARGEMGTQYATGFFGTIGEEIMNAIEQLTGPEQVFQPSQLAINLAGIGIGGKVATVTMDSAIKKGLTDAVKAKTMTPESAKQVFTAYKYYAQNTPAETIQAILRGDIPAPKVPGQELEKSAQQAGIGLARKPKPPEVIRQPRTDIGYTAETGQITPKQPTITPKAVRGAIPSETGEPITQLHGAKQIQPLAKPTSAERAKMTPAEQRLLEQRQFEELFPDLTAKPLPEGRNIDVATLTTDMSDMLGYGGEINDTVLQAVSAVQQRAKELDYTFSETVETMMRDGSLLKFKKGAELPEEKAVEIPKPTETLPQVVSGKFDVSNPPVSEKPISAVQLTNGDIYYDDSAKIHLDLINNLDIKPEDVADGGFIVDGKYVGGSANTRGIGEQARAKIAVQQKRTQQAETIPEQAVPSAEVPTEVIPETKAETPIPEAPKVSPEESEQELLDALRRDMENHKRLNPKSTSTDIMNFDFWSSGQNFKYPHTKEELNRLIQKYPDAIKIDKAKGLTTDVVVIDESILGKRISPEEVGNVSLEEQGFPTARMNPNDIDVRPSEMQFKRIDDMATGTNKEETLSGEWDELKGGHILVWQPKGEARPIVVNGHHRLKLAKENNVKSIEVKILREDDPSAPNGIGWSKKDAFAKGAEINIAEGKGTIYDRVEVLRNDRTTLSENEKIAKRNRVSKSAGKPYTISYDSTDNTLDAFTSRAISPDQAEIIAKTAPGDYDTQAIGIRLAKANKTGTDLEDTIQALKMLESDAKLAGSQLDMFGGGDNPLFKRADDIAKIVKDIKQEISDKILSVKGILKRPKQAGEMGAQLKDAYATEQEVKRLETEKAKWDKWYEQDKDSDIWQRIDKELKDKNLADTAQFTMDLDAKGESKVVKPETTISKSIDELTDDEYSSIKSSVEQMAGKAAMKRINTLAMKPEITVADMRDPKSGLAYSISTDPQSAYDYAKWQSQKEWSEPNLKRNYAKIANEIKKDHPKLEDTDFIQKYGEGKVEPPEDLIKGNKSDEIQIPPPEPDEGTIYFGAGIGNVSHSQGPNALQKVFREIGTTFNPTKYAPQKGLDILRTNIGRYENDIFRTQRITNKIKKKWDSIPELERYRWMDDMEKGKEKSPLGQLYRYRLDNIYNAITQYKKINYIDNFFPHFWDMLWKGKAPDLGLIMNAKRPMGGPREFLKHRTFEFIQDGVKAGGKLITSNPEELVQLKERSAGKFVLANEILEDSKKIGLAKFGSKFDVPDDYATINQNIAKVYFPKDVAQVVIGGKPTNRFVEAGEWYFQKDLARLLNNYFSKDIIYDTQIGKGIMDVKNTLNVFQLGLSAFHGTMVTMDAMTTQLSTGISKIVPKFIGGGGRPLKGMAEILKTPFAPFEYVYKGHQFFKGNPKYSKYDPAVFGGGARLQNRQYYLPTQWDTFLKRFREKKYGSAVFRAPIGIVQATMRPLMEFYVPRMKVGAFLHLYGTELERLAPEIASGKLSVEQVRASVWNNIENRLGEINYDNMFWNKGIKTGLMMGFRSVGWNLGTARELGGGIFIDPLKYAKDAVTGTKPSFTPKMAYTIGLFTLVAGAGAVYQYLHTGKAPQETKDYFYPQDGTTDANGNPNRREFPTYLKDLYQVSHHPIRTIANKLAPQFTAFLDLIQNKDFFGDYIRNENDNLPEQIKQVTKYLVKQFEPFSFQQVGQQRKGRTRLEQEIESFFGIIKAPSELIKSEAQKKLDELFREQSGTRGPRTPEQVEIQKLKSKARGEIPQGVKSEALKKLIASGELSPKSIERFIKSSFLPYQIRMYSYLSKENKLKYLTFLEEKAKKSKKTESAPPKPAQLKPGDKIKL